MSITYRVSFYTFAFVDVMSHGSCLTVRLSVNLLSQEDKQAGKRAVTIAQSGGLPFDSTC